MDEFVTKWYDNSEKPLDKVSEKCKPTTTRDNIRYRSHNESQAVAKT